MLTADLRAQKWCVWSGLVWGTLFFVALTMCGMFPPPSPLLSGEEIIALVQDRAMMAKAAIPLGILGAGLAIPFNSLIYGHILRIEQRDKAMPILAITSFGSGMCNVVAFLFTFYLWAAIFFRAAPDPGAVQLINDVVWLFIVMAFSAPALQMVCIALAGFRDTSENPVFPRWYNFLMLWIAIGTSTGCISIFFFKGPFAWNGIISFWIPASAFCVWLLSLCYIFLKHIKLQAEH